MVFCLIVNLKERNLKKMKVSFSPNYGNVNFSARQKSDKGQISWVNSFYVISPDANLVKSPEGLYNYAAIKSDILSQKTLQGPIAESMKKRALPTGHYVVARYQDIQGKNGEVDMAKVEKIAKKHNEKASTSYKFDVI